VGRYGAVLFGAMLSVYEAQRCLVVVQGVVAGGDAVIVGMRATSLTCVY
jgi:hypothetical protein